MVTHLYTCLVIYGDKSTVKSMISDKDSEFIYIQRSFTGAKSLVQ